MNADKTYKVLIMVREWASTDEAKCREHALREHGRYLDYLMGKAAEARRILDKVDVILDDLKAEDDAELEAMSHDNV